MATKNLIVFAKILPKPEYFDNAKKAIADILEPTNAEPGCFQFVLHENTTDKQLFLYEEWQDEDALQSHYQQPYTLKVFEQYKQWLAKPVEVTKMTKYDH